MNEWTANEHSAILALSKCTFLPGSYDKSFIHVMLAKYHNNDPMTDNQLANLWRLVWRYRRQHKERKLTDLAAMGLGLESLVKWMCGPQEVPPGSFVEYAPRSFGARRQSDLDKLARWQAGTRKRG